MAKRYRKNMRNRTKKKKRSNWYSGDRKEKYRWRNLRTETHVKGEEEHEGYVYVLKLWFDDLYKIGMAKNWQRRLRTLQAGNPKMSIVMAFPFSNPSKMEKELHKKYRFRRTERELFCLDEKKLNEICNYLYDMSVAGGIISKGLEGKRGIYRWEWKTNTEGLHVDVAEVFTELEFNTVAKGGTR